MTLGIIDVGTNSIHLLVGILGLNGKFHVLLKERDLTRLGEGGLAKGRLTRPAMRRALHVLGRYAATLRRFDVDHVEAVATSAVRSAANGRAFVQRVRRLGVPLRVISGGEEARLIYLGVVQAHGFKASTLVISIGGGSAQVMVGDGAHLRYGTSRPLGCARLAEEFIRHDPPKAEEVRALERMALRAWEPVAMAVRRYRWRHAVGSSATTEQLVAAANLLAYGKVKRKRRLSISRQSLRKLVRWLAESTVAERMRLPGLDPRREDLALPTAVVLLTWMEACRVPRLRYAPGSLREGLVLDYLIRHHARHARHLVEPASEFGIMRGKLG